MIFFKGSFYKQAKHLGSWIVHDWKDELLASYYESGKGSKYDIGINPTPLDFFVGQFLIGDAEWNILTFTL